MAARVSYHQFVERAVSRHGVRYDYSRSIYITKSDKVCIICPDHGEFWQTPDNHYRFGCIACGRQRTTDAKRKQTEQFIRDAVAVHGLRYDYSLVEYREAHTKVAIVCPDHGVFLQTPHSHTSTKRGCRKCFHQYRSIISRVRYRAGRWYSGTYRGITFLSLHELFWVVRAEEHGTHFLAIDQPDVRRTWQVPVVRKGRPGTYCGDFFLPDANEIIDIKPGWKIIKDADYLAQASEGYRIKGYAFRTIDCDSVPVNWQQFIDMYDAGEVRLFPGAIRLLEKKRVNMKEKAQRK